ncbi:MAG: hypothetical protein COB30_004075 [Ectothiorhodospiraceae bacterium]|nr:hypothetical protein [Ectothiorhodospiraceae bacterium]
MRRILISLLLLATLCTGSAFAWDKHPAVAFGHDVAVSDVMLSNTPLAHTAHDGDTDHGADFLKGGLLTDDHCSHGAAHIVGIFYSISSKTLNIDHSYRALAVVSLPYLYLSPLLRPPIV